MKDKISHVIEVAITDYKSTITCSKYLSGKLKDKSKSFEALSSIKRACIYRYRVIVYIINIK